MSYPPRSIYWLRTVRTLRNHPCPGKAPIYEDCDHRFMTLQPMKLEEAWERLRRTEPFDRFTISLQPITREQFCGKARRPAPARDVPATM